MRKISFVNLFLAGLALLAMNLNSFAQNALFSGFQNPPETAKPVVWWHWTGSNVTKVGITKDLEWMQRAGIGGFQAFDVSFGFGQSVDTKVKYMSPEWLELLRHAAAEADRLGLHMTIVTAAGWSETGGTWVKPQEAMKKLVWSETKLAGGKRFIGKLPQPPMVNGAIRNLPKPQGFMGMGVKLDPFYADVTVLAYKTPEAELTIALPKITNQKGENIAPEALLDDDLTTKISLEVPKPDQPAFLQFEYERPFTARAFSLAMGGAGDFGSKIWRNGLVQASTDGKNWQTLFALPGAQHDIRALPVRTFSFPAVTARFFRVVFMPGSGMTTVGGPDDRGGFPGFGATPPPTAFDLTEAIFYPGARVNRWEDKANFAPMFAFETLQTPPVSSTAVIPKDDVVELSAKMNAEGVFEWEVPPGNWTVLRIGYSLTGAKNGPAMPEATGYEVDKLRKTHLESHMRQWSEPIAKALGPLYGKSLRYFLVDSYEADAQNWTEDMLQEFTKRRGYDPFKYLPVLAGRVVESAEVSDRFLWDFRLTIAEMLVDNHYAALTDWAHQKGIKTYGEVAGISMPVIQDALRNKGAVDIPMAEFGMAQGLGSGADKDWVSPADLETQKPFGGANDRLLAHQADVREAASAAHIYGKKVVAAESWTGGSYEAPADMKFIGDYWSTQGINQFIFHTSAHQPLDTKPGNVMVGTHFHRNITWAEQAKPFTAYIARNQYLLQEGRFVADIAYFLGEDIPVAVPYWEKPRYEAPAGYDYDFVNTEILQRFTVENGELVLPSGMRYKMLVLPERNTMTLAVLDKIVDLVQNGAIVVGPKPEKSPGLSLYPEADKTVASKANALWGGADGKFVFQNNYGKGKVFWNAPLAGIFGQMDLKKDLDYAGPHLNTRLAWMHRKTSDTDFYFVLNMRNQVENLEVSCRVAGKAPEIWRADKGTSEPLSYRIEKGTTTVSLHLEPQESAFLVFQKNATQNTLALLVPQTTALENLQGAWTLSFPEKLGAPSQIVLNELESWTNHPDEGVRYFSGTASYTKDFDLKKPALKPGAALWLDLGVVKDIATVWVNGIELETLWKVPYQVDISRAVKVGKNKLEIKVANQWTNRIIGDKQPGVSTKVLAGTIPFIQANTPLRPSGLLGPVQLFEKK